MSNDINLEIYTPKKRELIYLKSICEKLQGKKDTLPSDLKPKSKREH